MEFTPLNKDKDNPFFKSRYISLDNIISATRDGLTKNGIALLQFITGTHELVTVVTRLAHVSGQWIQSEVSSKPQKADIQQQGSVSTYLKRYSMAAILGINCEVDDDGDSAVFISVDQIARLDNALGDNEQLRAQILSRYKELKKIPIAEYEKILTHVSKTNGVAK
jgi:hypothetical protein